MNKTTPIRKLAMAFMLVLLALPLSAKAAAGSVFTFRFLPEKDMFFTPALNNGDELADDGNTLPEGKYPLGIASVTMDVTHSEQPWSADVPQTRVSENTDRNSSVWDGGESIGVRIANGTETAVYILQSNKITLQPANKPLYWKNTTSSKVCAWFPADGEVDLSKQTSELAYALFAETTDAVDYNTTNINLPFEHKFAKVRVVLAGEKKGDVTDVKIKTFTSCTLKTDGRRYARLYPDGTDNL